VTVVCSTEGLEKKKHKTISSTTKHSIYLYRALTKFHDLWVPFFLQKTLNYGTFSFSKQLLIQVSDWLILALISKPLFEGIIILISNSEIFAYYFNQHGCRSSTLYCTFNSYNDL